MLDNFQFASLGEVGRVVKAIVLHPTDPPFKYVMSPVDPEVISHVTVEMSAKVRVIFHFTIATAWHNTQMDVKFLQFTVGGLKFYALSDNRRG